MIKELVAASSEAISGGIGLNSPYTYSDMSGGQTNKVISPAP